MRLWRRNEAPVGGWYYLIEGTEMDGQRVPQGGFALGLDDLYQKTFSIMKGNAVTPPDYLFELIEDQICRRQPEGKCRYTRKPGDVVSKIIHGVAGAIDSVAGTQLKQRARGCGGCGKRRVKLNSLSR
jgi:hypothetical protein